MKLIQTEKCSIIYGTFHGKENQELFRCKRELDNVDLKNYINENRCILGWETETADDLHTIPGYMGYYRLYFRDGSWHGRWMNLVDSDAVNKTACYGVDEIIRWLFKTFPKGCDWEMTDWLSKYPACDKKGNRYLLKPLMSEHYKVMFDTTYGNEDYPVRIYLYK